MVKNDGNECNFRKTTTNIMINKGNNKHNDLPATKLQYLEATQLVLA